MKKLFIPILLLILACTDDEGNPCVYEPTLTTEEVTDITESTATFNGVINNTSENCETPNNIEQGFVYSTEIQPTLDDNQVNVNGTSISTTIENLEPNTSYYVRTFLTNSFGEFYGDEVSFTTNEPNTVPDAPSITNVSAGDGQVDITFDAPANDGGSTISEYTATSSPGNITSTISQAEGGTITVKGLTNGTTYSFTVTATNGVGTSDASDTSNEVIPAGVPDAPKITIVAAGDGQVDITFDAPANDGGSTITEYTATSSPGNISSTISQAEGGTITVKGLTNGTAYTFIVTATNGVGTSSPSNASNSVTPLEVNYPEGTVHCDPNSLTEVVNVTNPTTGETWMDRNLGASQVATSSTDSEAIGDLYQWGRGADGHQCRGSQNTSTLSSTDQPGHGDFITNPSRPYDWRSPQNDNLWQGVDGVNNPCPSGYRLPTIAELEAERLGWSSNDAAGAFASSLKLPMAAGRSGQNGSVVTVGGGYWSSTFINKFSRILRFGSSASTGSTGGGGFRRGGIPVRCIKD